MGEYSYSITDNTDRSPEDADKVFSYCNWYDNTEPKARLKEAIKLGYIEAEDGDEALFLEVVLEEARRMNHGPEWIKEIMDRERKFDNSHIDIAEEAIEQEATVKQLKEAFKELVAIRDWAIGANKETSG